MKCVISEFVPVTEGSPSAASISPSATASRPDLFDFEGLVLSLLLSLRVWRAGLPTGWEERQRVKGGHREGHGRRGCLRGGKGGEGGH